MKKVKESEEKTDFRTPYKVKEKNIKRMLEYLKKENKK
jgi:hypothetical protein